MIRRCGHYSNVTIVNFVVCMCIDIVAMLMDPISYATQVLKEMDEELVSKRTKAWPKIMTL